MASCGSANFLKNLKSGPTVKGDGSVNWLPIEGHLKGSPDFVVENRAFPGMGHGAWGMENAFPARLSPKILVFLITKESGEPFKN